MNQLKKIFKTERPLIGMIHFPPLIGYPDCPGFEYIAKKMMSEATILEKTGFHGIIIENNYDNPHNEKISAPSAAMFASLARLLQDRISIPFGLDVLWNDYETALSICASTKASFFRVPAFVDTVKTSYGIMPARAKEIILLRKKLGLEDIAVFTDIQVKHSIMLDEGKTLATSAKQAMESGSDAIIITGKWTGNAPEIKDLKEVRLKVKEFPILIGSGASTDNLATLLKYADGVIVGTALKTGKMRDKSDEVNIKPFFEKISLVKSKEFKKAFDTMINLKI